MRLSGAINHRDFAPSLRAEQDVRMQRCTGCAKQALPRHRSSRLFFVCVSTTIPVCCVRSARLRACLVLHKYFLKAAEVHPCPILTSRLLPCSLRCGFRHLSLDARQWPRWERAPARLQRFRRRCLLSARFRPQSFSNPVRR